MVNMEELVKAYLTIRNEREKLKALFEQQDEALKGDMEGLEKVMLQACSEVNADSIRTQHGTVMRGVKTRYWTSDWQAMHDFIMEHKMPELLEKRISQTTMRQLLDENPDMMPMGLNVDSKYSVTIRRTSNGS